MAERTQTDGSQGTPEPTTVDLRDPSEISTVEVDAASDTTPDPRDAELTTLRQQNERLRQQVSGSGTEARRLAEEQRLSSERIARLEGALQQRGDSASQSRTGETTTPLPSFTKGKLKTALQKWLNGDEADLDAVEDELGRIASTPRTTTTVQEPVKSADLQALIRNELREIGTSEVVRQSVATVHPEMGDTTSPVYAAVFNTYDAYANDQTNRLMYPQDEKFAVTIPSPDGTQSKVVDARIVRQLAGDVKLQLGGRSIRQASVGQTQGGNGNTTSTPSNRAVEAIDLLTQYERDEILNFQQLRVWPKEWPKDIKAAAKFIYDGLDPVEKSRRVTEYKRTMRTGA